MTTLYTLRRSFCNFLSSLHSVTHMTAGQTSTPILRNTINQPGPTTVTSSVAGQANGNNEVENHGDLHQINLTSPPAVNASHSNQTANFFWDLLYSRKIFTHGAVLQALFYNLHSWQHDIYLSYFNLETWILLGEEEMLFFWSLRMQVCFR